MLVLFQDLASSIRMLVGLDQYPKKHLYIFCVSSEVFNLGFFLNFTSSHPQAPTTIFWFLCSSVEMYPYLNHLVIWVCLSYLELE